MESLGRRPGAEAAKLVPPRPVVPVVPRAFDRKPQPRTHSYAPSVDDRGTDDATGHTVSRHELAGSDELTSRPVTSAPSSLGSDRSVNHHDDTDTHASALHSDSVHRVSPVIPIVPRIASYQTPRSFGEFPSASKPRFDSVALGHSHIAHADTGLTFGSSTSEDSSPAPSPSATTTYSQVTPLSDDASTQSPLACQGAENTSPFFRDRQGCSSPPQSQGRHGSDEAYNPPQVPAPPLDPFQAPPPLVEPAHILALEALRQSLAIQFQDSNLADAMLHIEADGELVTCPLHRILLQRSPTLTNLLNISNERGTDGLFHAMLRCQEPFSKAQAIIAGLSTLYGISASNALNVLLGERRSRDPQSSSADDALAFLAAGITLQLPDVEFAGAKVASQSLSWGNVDKVLAFCIYPLVSLPHRPSQPSQECAKDPLAELMASCRSPFVVELLHNTLSFMFTEFSQHFVLDVAAPASAALHGLPYIAPTPIVDTPARLPKHGSRPSRIQFGAFPAAFDPTRSMISSILLSAPLPLLRFLVQNLARPDLTGEIIAERERRRTSYLSQNDNLPAKHELLQERATWEEAVATGGLGLSITQHRAAV